MLLLAFPAAYALSIRPVRKWSDVLFFFLSTKMLPLVAGLLPIYLFAQKAHMLDNLFILIILYTTMNLPIAVWMMRSFLAEVPIAIIEAAAIDGAGVLLHDAQDRRADRGAGHRGHRAHLLHLQLERAVVRPGANRGAGTNGTGVPDQLRHQPGPVPGQGVRGRRRGVHTGRGGRLRRAGQARTGPIPRSRQVRAAIIKSAGNVSVETVDDPTPGPGEV